MFAVTRKSGRPEPAGNTMRAQHPIGSANGLLRRHGEMDEARQPRPGTAVQLVELFAGDRDAGAIGFALAQLPAGRPVLWVQDRMSRLETGLPYAPGLARFGLAPGQILSICAAKPADVLWAMEEGLKCAALGAVIGELWGDPKALDFTATRRLAMRAERNGIAVFLVRFAAAAGISAARRRWHIASAPSIPDANDLRAPGTPRWQAELFRARDAKPGKWEAHYDAKAHRLDFSAAFCHSALAPPHPERRLEAANDHRGSAHSARASGAAWPAGA